jgi:hypothetical protein
VAKQPKADQKAVKFFEFARGTRAGGANSQNFKRRNEEEGFFYFYGASRQNNLESPPRDLPRQSSTIAGHCGIGGWEAPQ